MPGYQNHEIIQSVFRARRWLAPLKGWTKGSVSFDWDSLQIVLRAFQIWEPLHQKTLSQQDCCIWYTLLWFKRPQIPFLSSEQIFFSPFWSSPKIRCHQQNPIYSYCKPSICLNNYRPSSFCSHSSLWKQRLMFTHRSILFRKPQNKVTVSCSDCRKTICQFKYLLPWLHTSVCENIYGT